MKTILMILMTSLMAPAAFAVDYTTYDCQLRVEREGKQDFLMKGIIRLRNDGKDENSYLSLEPPTVAGMSITARVLLTRFDGDLYFPMTLHPRGDTSIYLAHVDIQSDPVGRLTLEDDGKKYTFVCGQRATH